MHFEREREREMFYLMLIPRVFAESQNTKKEK